MDLGLTRAGRADLAVFDVAGRRVRTVFSGSLGPGVHTFEWPGDSVDGSAAAPGIYFLRVVSDEGAETRKVTVRTR